MRKVVEWQRLRRGERIFLLSAAVERGGARIGIGQIFRTRSVGDDVGELGLQKGELRHRQISPVSHAADARTSRCTPVFFCNTRMTSDRLAAVGLPLGPNIRMRLLGGIPVALANAGKPVVALMKSRNTARAVPTSPSIKVCTASWNSACRNPGSDWILALMWSLKLRVRAICGLINDARSFEPCSPPTVLPRKQDDPAAKTLRYEGYDIITLQKLVEREYHIPEPQTAEEVIGYYARRIAQDVKLPSQFSALAPKVREFLETKAFGERVVLNEPGMIKAISSNVAQYVTVKSFVEALRKLVISELQPQLLHGGRALSETPPFPWSRPTIAADKSVFNLVPCHNEFEKEFARFLQKADDVDCFAKLPEQFGFAIEYTDSVSNLRYYEPDFVVLTRDGTHYIAETKGLEDVNVVNKDRAAHLWCENTTSLTGKPWAYVKILQTAYKQLQPNRFEDLLVLEQKKLV